MKTIVFCGPTISPDDVRAIVCAECLPPVAQGDILHAMEKYHPSRILIVDGVFEQSMSVWMKEILFAISQGIEVCGSSSMGALRAAELHDFGMKGFGKIFAMIRDGHIMDDDAVAVSHSTAEFNFRQTSIALVDIIFHATRKFPDRAKEIIENAKALHYSERIPPRFLPKDIAPRQWAMDYESQKKADAMEMLLWCADNHPKFNPRPFFKSLSFYGQYERDRCVGDIQLDDIAAASLCRGVRHVLDHGNAMNRQAALMLAMEKKIEVLDEEIADECGIFFENHSLKTSEQISRWMQDNHIHGDEFRDLMREQALIRKVHRAIACTQMLRRTTKPLLDYLRLSGQFPAVFDRCHAGNPAVAELVDHATIPQLKVMLESCGESLALEPCIHHEIFGFHTNKELKAAVLKRIITLQTTPLWDNQQEQAAVKPPQQ